MSTQRNNANNVSGLLMLAVFIIMFILTIVLPLLFSSSSPLVAILSGLIALLGTFFSFLQIPGTREALARLFQSSSLRSSGSRNFLPILAVLVLLSLALNIVQAGIIFTHKAILFNGPPIQTAHSSPTTLSTASSMATTPTLVSTETTTPQAPDQSSLIPDSSPVLNDPLDGSSNPYKWDTGTQGSLTCTFLNHAYHISVPANNGGGECNTEAPNLSFTQFVYQIKMVILKGLNGQGGAGPSFYTSNQLNGSFYRVSFNANGAWTFGYLTGGNGGAADHQIIGGTTPYFLPGDGQVNYITIKVQKHLITVQVNGHQLFSQQDTTLNGGAIGVELGDPGPQDAEVAFSDAQVWQL